MHYNDALLSRPSKVVCQCVCIGLTDIRVIRKPCTRGGAVYLDETLDGVVLRTAAQALAKQYTDRSPAMW
jgi:hypothetical protein